MTPTASRHGLPRLSALPGELAHVGVAASLDVGEGLARLLELGALEHIQAFGMVPLASVLARGQLLAHDVEALLLQLGELSLALRKLFGLPRLHHALA